MRAPRSVGALWFGLGVMVFSAACGSDSTGTGANNGPAKLAIVSGNGQVGLIGTALSTPLVVKVSSSGGTALSGIGVTFAVTSGAASLNPTTTTTDAAGQAKTTVTFGSQSGTVQVTATVSGSSLSATFVLTAGTTAVTNACAAGAAQTPTVGSVLPGVSGTGVCLGGGASGADYALVAFYGNRDSSSTASFTVRSQNAVGLATASVAPANQTTLAPGTGESVASLVTASSGDFATRFDLGLRRIAREQLTRLIPAARAARSGLRPSFSVIPQGALTVNQVISLNANSVNPCSNPINIGARVAAISQTAYILADTANPSGGFTDAEYASFGTTFDTLVSPVDIQNFGQPTDIDKNGKIVILFTKEINKLTPRGENAVVGGSFFERDLFPVTTQNGLDGCATSNVGEMFYTLVPDPNGVFSDRRSKTNVLDFTIGTLAHEYQHLINAGRRLYVNDAFTFEEGWLNEGLSHIAEELLYYRVAHLGPRQNLGITEILAADTGRTWSNYQGSNMGRYQEFLSHPQQVSVYAGNDDLDTRGATWNLLRYLADHRSTSDAETWQALVNSKVSGHDNLSNVFGAAYMTQIRDWATSVFSDDVTGVTDAKYLEPSWNMRSIFPRILDPSTGHALGRYPLSVFALSDALPANITVQAGGAAYVRFTVPAGASGSIDWSAGGLPVNPLVQFTVVRTR